MTGKPAASSAARPDIPPAAELTRVAERDAEDLSSALAVLRERIAHEFRITERLEAKSRQAFALAAGFFAIAQAGAFASFGAEAISSTERFVVLGAALLTAISVIAVAARLRAVEELREEDEVLPDTIYAWCRDQTESRSVTAHLVWALSEVAHRRKHNNDGRTREARAVTTASGVALILAAVELALALATRI